MLIDPKVKKLIIFNGGGGIVQREIKLSLNQGENKFQIQNVPASFDPNSADIKLEYVNPGDKEFIALQQTIVSLPDKNNVERVIEREKSAANNIISYAIDFTREMREKVSNICEASSYRTYADMTGVFDFIINARKESEVIVKIIYFISDIRIKWETTLQINIKDDNKTAEIEGFLIVNNQTGFSYNNVELGFAIFELPSESITLDSLYLTNKPEAYYEVQQEEAELPQQVMKRTQRLKNLML
ncbi:MAG: hypothetical protein ACTSQJ_14345 [Promethearchaeota archaeon]